LHIAIVAPERYPVPPKRGESVEICIMAIAQKLAERHRVTVISRAYAGLPKREVRGRLTIVRLRTGTTKRYLRSVLGFLKGRRFDWIQVDNRPRYVGPIKELLPQTGVSLFLHSLNFVSPPKLSGKAATACLRQADLIIANSASLRQELGRRFPKVLNRIRQVWLGVDSRRFRPAAEKEKASLRRKHRVGKGFVVLFAGRVIERKGLPVLIKAMGEAQQRIRVPMELVVAGRAPRGGYGQKQRRLAARLGVKARFLGAVPHGGMPAVYRLADCFVCPSQEHEAFGLVNVEAMACGVPVVASSLGGMKEIIRHGENGLLVQQYRSPRSFAKVLRRLAGSSALRKRLSAGGRRAALRRFGWGQTARRLESAYSVHSRRKGG
jgi:spore coat protein SA